MRSLGAAVLLVSLAACGSSTPATPPSPAPTTSTATGDSSLDAIATEARTRDVCGDANEALLRRLVPDLFACATQTRLAYVIARTSAGTVLAIPGWQPRAEGHPSPDDPYEDVPMGALDGL